MLTDARLQENIPVLPQLPAGESPAPTPSCTDNPATNNNRTCMMLLTHTRPQTTPDNTATQLNIGGAHPVQQVLKAHASCGCVLQHRWAQLDANTLTATTGRRHHQHQHQLPSAAASSLHHMFKGLLSRPPRPYKQRGVYRFGLADEAPACCLDPVSGSEGAPTMLPVDLLGLQM